MSELTTGPGLTPDEAIDGKPFTLFQAGLLTPVVPEIEPVKPLPDFLPKLRRPPQEKPLSDEDRKLRRYMLGDDIAGPGGAGGAVVALRVEEQDGTPSAAASKIKVPNGTLTDLGNGDVSLNYESPINKNVASGYAGLDASAPFTDGSVVFANSTGLLTQDNANLKWDNALDRLTIGAGSLTVNGKPGQENVINESGVDQDLRVEGDADANLLFADASVDRVGVGTSAPNVKLDVNGGVALRATSPATITADQNDYAIGAGTFFRLSSDAQRTITGITGGTDGKLLILRNVGVNNIVLANDSASSAAANRMLTGVGHDVIVPPNAAIQLIYDATDSRWQVM